LQGLGRLRLSLPSAKEIEAGEREEAEAVSVRYPSPLPPPPPPPPPMSAEFSIILTFDNISSSDLSAKLGPRTDISGGVVSTNHSCFLC